MGSGGYGEAAHGLNERVDERHHAGADRIDGRQAEPVGGRLQRPVGRGGVQSRGIEAEADAAHRRVGQLRRGDVGVDAVLEVV